MKEFRPQQSIHALIFEAYLTHLLIGSGTGSIDDPIVLLPDIEYVRNEYEVMTFLGFYRNIDYEREGQTLIKIGNRYIDCLTFIASDMANGKEEWTEQYYFDVTDCLFDHNSRVIKQ